jgi:hypothetical protein
MQTFNLNKFLESFNYLTLDENEYVLDIFKKQIIELKRADISQRSKEVKSNLKKNKVKSGGFDELYKDLEND